MTENVISNIVGGFTYILQWLTVVFVLYDTNKKLSILDEEAKSAPLDKQELFIRQEKIFYNRPYLFFV